MWAPFLSRILILLVSASFLLTPSAHGLSKVPKITRKKLSDRNVTRNDFNLDPARRSLTAAPERLKYFGGPLLTTPVINVYLVYYGQWTTYQKNAVRGLINSFTNSNTTPQGTGVNTVAGWWSLVAKYYDSNKRYASGKVVIKREANNPNYSLGRNLRNSDTVDDVFNLISHYIDVKIFPLDPTGVYMVLTDPHVRVGDAVNGFCGSSDSAPCGWHVMDYYGATNTPINYGFAGNGALLCDGCVWTDNSATATVPSGDRGIDGMLSTIAHEIAETVTDPNVQTGWVTSTAASGDENGDICADIFDGSKTITRGGNTYVYNLVGQGGLKYYIQDMYDIRDNTCKINAASVGGPTASPPSGPGTVDPYCSNNDDYTCTLGCNTPKDGCVCLKGRCVPFCIWAGVDNICTNCATGSCACNAAGKCVPY